MTSLASRISPVVGRRLVAGIIWYRLVRSAGEGMEHGIPLPGPTVCGDMTRVSDGQFMIICRNGVRRRRHGRKGVVSC